MAMECKLGLHCELCDEAVLIMLNWFQLYMQK